MYVKTIDLFGTVTGRRTRYEVAGIPSVPYVEYAVDVNGVTHFADALPGTPHYGVGDDILMTCTVYGYERERNRVHPADVENWTGDLLRYTETWCDLVIQNCQVA